MAEPSPSAVATFNRYSAAVEARLSQQHRTPNSILASVDANKIRNGNLLIERVTEPISPAMADIPGAMLHHWRGTAFVPQAHAADFLHLARDFDHYAQHFSPDVLSAQTVSQQGNRIQTTMRIRQHHVITVVMDTAYDVAFTPIGPSRGSSISHSTRITEIASPGTPQEHALSPGEEHGFLYGLNTYWTYEERDGGLYLQIEAVSLSRSIPTGLGWAIGPYVQSIPKESLEFTLRSAAKALRK